MNLSDVIRPLDTILKNCHIPYAVIGGYAVAAWGEERATRDIDLFCTGDSRAILKALENEPFQFEHRVGDWDDPISEIIRIDMGANADPFEVDVIIGIRNAPSGILNRIRTLHLEGLAIPIASPEDMILLKLLGGSARDIEDARSIVHTQSDKLDLEFMRRLCPESIKSNLEEILNKWGHSPFISGK